MRRKDSDAREKSPAQLQTRRGGVRAGGFVRGDGKLTLEPSEDNKTAVLVSGDAQVGGLIAGVGQRLLDGVAKQMMGQFFRSLQSQLGTRLAKSGG
jgi:carbon monoxide dehydrogenase subunit G